MCVSSRDLSHFRDPHLMIKGSVLLFSFAESQKIFLRLTIKKQSTMLSKFAVRNLAVAKKSFGSLRGVASLSDVLAAQVPLKQAEMKKLKVGSREWPLLLIPCASRDLANSPPLFLPTVYPLLRVQ